MNILKTTRFTVQIRTVVILYFFMTGSLCIWAHDHTKPKTRVSIQLTQVDSIGENVSSKADNDSICRLTLKLVDSETKKPFAGCVRIKTIDDEFVPLNGLLNRGIGLRKNNSIKQWYVLLESATILVPQKELIIEAISGLETELTQKTVDLSGKISCEVKLMIRRFYDSNSEGWHNGNTHLHLKTINREQADQYLRYVSRADELNFVFVSYLIRPNNDHSYISNSYKKKDLQNLSWHGVTFGYGEEHRHNFGPPGEGYGHVMFLDVDELIHPVSIGPGIMGEGNDSPSLRFAINKSRRDGSTLIWCHNAWGMQDVPEWIAETLHAHNIFDGGSQGSYEDTFYRFMNIGLRVPFSTGTDWFIYDFSRVYVNVPHSSPTIPKWLEALRSGRSFITNGPLLELYVDEYRSGDIIRLKKPKQLKIRGKAVGRNDFQKIEIIQNGMVLKSKESYKVDMHFQSEITYSVQINEPGWIALRINSNNRNLFGRKLFGHTSAVYVEFDGESIFKADAANKLIVDMQTSICTIQEKAIFADDIQREQVLNIYREGIKNLNERLKQK
jgi:hypothetical protein